MIKPEIRTACRKLMVIPALLFFLACNPGALSEKRDQKAATADILIGIVQTSVYANFFLEGVRMAVEEINQGGGLLGGRKVRTIICDDMKDILRGERVAAKLAGNSDVIAVVGHVNSDIAIPASVIYEKAGIVFISHGAKDPDLTLYSGNFTFRNIPTQKAFGHQMAEFSHARKLRKAVVFHERGAEHKSLADIFKEEATNLGIEILATRSYFSWETDFKEVIAQVKKEYTFDSILVSGTMPAAAELVKEIREMGISVPIIGGDGLDSPDLFAIAGRAAEGVIVPTVFDPGYPDKLTRDFVRRFQEQYELTPDTWAAQGYDAIALIAHAIEESGSADPIVISTTLRFLEKWKTITGSYAFTPRGDITGKEIFFKIMRKGGFVFVGEKPQYDANLFNYIEELTLRLPMNEPIFTLDPGLVKNESDVEVCEQLFLALTALEPETYKPVPELAKDWTLSRISERIYIFHLREDAKWTDGEPVTANDVQWAIRHHLSPGTRSPNARELFILHNAEAIYNGEIKDMSKLGVYVPDDFTVVFKLKQPAPYFPTLVSLPVYRPLPGANIELYKDNWTDLNIIQVNGPYEPVIWEKAKGMFLRKNPSYYDAEKVAIPEVRYYLIPQSSVGLAMYENNELDIMGSSYLRLPEEAVPRIKEEPVIEDEYHKAPHFCTYTYAFNVQRPPVDNLLVRKAISAAIDRQLLIDTVNGGNGEPATTCTRPPLLGSVPPEAGVGIGFDPFQAQEWLAEAGYPEGKDFPIITILHKKSKFQEKVAKGVQSLLEHYLNIPVRLQEENEEAYDAIVTRGNPPHIFRVKVCNAYPDADSSMRLFDPSENIYQTGWKDKEYDELINIARSVFDEPDAEALYKRGEEILCEEQVVAIPLYFEIYHSLVKSRVKGWHHMAMSGQQIYNWYFEEE